MGRARCWLAVVLALLLQRLLLVHLPVWGVCPLVLPPLLCLLGMETGEDRGAECGLLGGILCWLAGASPWFIALYPLVGGISGKVFHRTQGFWGKWLRTLPVLAGMELFLVLRSLLPGADVLAVLGIAGPELLLSAACFPLAAGISALVSPRKKRSRF